MEHNSNKRLESLYGYQILDSKKTPLFDNLTKLASQIADCPVSIVAIVDKNRTWFKSSYGLPEEFSEVDNSASICRYLAECNEEYLEVLNIQEDSRFSDNSIIKNNIFKYYFGVPLLDKEGQRLGTLCVLDKMVKESLQPSKKEQIFIISQQVMALIEHHRLSMENDISQQRILESSRASVLNEITRGVAHEINNPLTVLKASVDILQSNKKDETLIKSVIEKMNKSIDSIHKVISVMRENHKVGNQSFCSLKESLVISQNLFLKRFSKEGISIEVKDYTQEKDLKIPSSLQQVVFHLLQNSGHAALKNTLTSPKVVLKINKVNEFLMLTIEDSGKGVPEEKIPALFSGLFHSNYNGESIGIGLNTCKKIIESLGGNIRFVKNHPTTFEVSIPLKSN